MFKKVEISMKKPFQTRSDQACRFEGLVNCLRLRLGALSIQIHNKCLQIERYVKEVFDTAWDRCC